MIGARLGPGREQSSEVNESQRSGLLASCGMSLCPCHGKLLSAPILVERLFCPESDCVWAFLGHLRASELVTRGTLSSI